MNLKLILKGFMVGIGKIIPGVSGSLLAMSLGIYEPLIKAITDFKSNIKDNFKLLFNFCLGFLIAIILFSRIILFFINNYYYETIYLFLGLILGTLINFIKGIKFKKNKIYIFIILFILMMVLTNFKTGNNYIFKGNMIDYMYIIFLGFIDALSSIIPGISGTVIYMLLGCYQFVLSILSKPFSLIFIFYFIGLLLGIIIICYLMNYLFKYRREETYMGILALMVASLLILFLNIVKYFNIIGLLFLLGGLLIGLKLKD